MLAHDKINDYRDDQEYNRANYKEQRQSRIVSLYRTRLRHAGGLRSGTRLAEGERRGLRKPLSIFAWSLLHPLLSDIRCRHRHRASRARRGEHLRRVSGSWIGRCGRRGRRRSRGYVASSEDLREFAGILGRRRRPQWRRWGDMSRPTLRGRHRRLEIAGKFARLRRLVWRRSRSGRPLRLEHLRELARLWTGLGWGILRWWRHSRRRRGNRALRRLKLSGEFTRGRRRSLLGNRRL
jgi:hypothetical protein